jgi:hypothetical protein
MIIMYLNEAIGKFQTLTGNHPKFLYLGKLEYKAWKDYITTEVASGRMVMDGSASHDEFRDVHIIRTHESSHLACGI